MIKFLSTISLIILFQLLMPVDFWIQYLPSLTPVTTTYAENTFLGGDAPLENPQAPFNPDKQKYANLGDYIKEMYIYSIWLIAAISIVMIVWGGYQIIMSSGSPEGVQKGRATIVSALISLAILALAYTLLYIISPNIPNNVTPPKGNLTVQSTKVGLLSSASGRLPFDMSSLPDEIKNWLSHLPSGINIDDVLENLNIPGVNYNFDYGFGDLNFGFDGGSIGDLF